ncbi:MAG TPA: hypothetical protein VFI90_19785 [Rubrobacter sp.]|nr:hypothetical protein [Rubrobacter sp.]
MIGTLFHAGWDITNSQIVPAFMPEMVRMFPNNEVIYAVFGVLAVLLMVLTRGRLS